MTFCGDRPFVPSGIHHHLFENLRRKGHHCHGLTHLSWAERKIFYRVLGKKFCGLFIYPGQSVRQVVAVSAPGDRDSYGCVAPAGNEQGPAATTESACAKRRCPLHPGGLLPGCQERRPRRDRGGATGTVAASQGFCVRDGSPPGRRQLRWLRSRQPAPPGGRPEKAQAEEEQDRQ